MLKIEILGPGSSRCEQVEKTVRQIVQEMALDAEVTKVKDMSKIASYGAVYLPGLAINGKLVHSDGSVPDKARLSTLITSALVEQ